jgi:hypothetical protein
LIVFYYSKWYGNFSDRVVADKKLNLSEKSIESFEKEFIGTNAKEDYRILKELLKPLGFTVPTLYKQYTELCEDGGVEFLDFGIDESFEMCIDGFIQIEVDKIRADKKARYIDIHAGQQAVA